MHHLVRLCGSIFLAALPALLSAQKVTVEFDEAMEFGSLKTFTLQNGQAHSRNPALNNDIVRKNLETNIRKKLTEKGLTEATSQPDLNVSWALGSANRTQVERYPAGWRTRRVAVRYTEGTLTIDMRDPRRHELVWRAVAVEDNRDPNKIQARLDAMVISRSTSIRPRRSDSHERRG